MYHAATRETADNNRGSLLLFRYYSLPVLIWVVQSITIFLFRVFFFVFFCLKLKLLRCEESKQPRRQPLLVSLVFFLVSLSLQNINILRSPIYPTNHWRSATSGTYYCVNTVLIYKRKPTSRKVIIILRCCCIVWVKIFRKGEVLVVLVVSGFDNGANSIFESNPHAYKEIDVTSNPEALKQMSD